MGDYRTAEELCCDELTKEKADLEREIADRQEDLLDNARLRRQRADLLAALEDALYRWNGLTQERRDEILALAPDPIAQAKEDMP